MSPLTIYLGRFFGLSCLLMCAAMAARPKTTLSAMNAMIERPDVILITGVFTLFAGVAVAVGHNIWSGGALPIAVTVLGWITLIKGLALIVIPPEGLRAFYKAMHYPQRFRLVMGASALFGLWLTMVAFQA
jgi:hypothetical protein